MKKTIIYLGITLMAFSSLSFASNTNVIGNQRALNNFNESPAPLSVAISKGEIETVKKFIEYGADVNEKSNGVTPLMLAARYNKVEILKLLVSNGAKLNEKDEKGYTAMKYAEVSNAVDAVQYLKQV